jgi:molybdopterin/thiamine biosynthesis adenylyltransferase
MEGDFWNVVCLSEWICASTAHSVFKGVAVIKQCNMNMNAVP